MNPKEAAKDKADKAERKSRETITMSRRQAAALYIGSFAGVFGMLSHIIDFLHQIGLL